MDYELLFFCTVALSVLITFFLLCAYFGYCRLKDKNEALEQELEIKSADIDKLDLLLERTNQEYSESTQAQITKYNNLLQEKTKLLTTCEYLEAQIRQLQHSRETTLEEFGKIRDSIRQEFALMASTQLDEAQKKALSQNQQQLALLLNPVKGDLQHLLDPLRNHLANLRQEVSNSHNQSMILNERLEQMVNAQQELSQEAQHIANALHNTKQQGCWGEMILEKSLENAGLIKNLHYEREKFFKGVRADFRPDVILHLPNNQEVIIDSKCSLNAFVNLQNAPDQESYQAYLKQQVENIRSHVNVLGGKHYEQIAELAGRVWNFVIMFLPSDQMFSCTLELDPNLVQYAYARNIIITTPSTLMCCLMMVKQLWREHDQSSQYVEAINSLSFLYDSITKAFKCFSDVQSAQATLNKRLDQLQGALRGGRKSVAAEMEQVCRITGQESLLPRVVEDAEDEQMADDSIPA